MGTTLTVEPPPRAVRYREMTGRLAELAGHRNAVDAEIVALLEEVIDTDAWAVDGIRTVIQWVTWQLGITAGEAKRLVDVATARAAHPAVTALFDTGRLSLAQASIASRVAAHRDAEIADLITVLTVSQLQTYVRAMHHSDADPSPGPPDPQPVDERAEFMRFGWDDTGWLCGRFELDAEHGHQFETALTHARDLLFHHHDTNPTPTTADTDNAADADDDAADDDVVAVDADIVDTETAGDVEHGEADADVTGDQPAPAPAPAPIPVLVGRVGWVDALVLLGTRSLDAEPSTSRRDRYRINVHLHPDRDQHLVWADWSRVPDWLNSRLLCDATISPVYTNGTAAVSVGRSQRIITNRLRRLITHRDHATCRVPWCTNHHWLDIHHLTAWTDGGRTDTANLAAICPACHHAIHRGHLTITGNADQPDGLTFTDRHGQPIHYLPDPIPPDRPPPTPTHPYQHPYGEQLHRADIYIDPPPWRQPHQHPAA